MISPSDFFETVERVSGKKLSSVQRELVEETEGVIWVTAGPGSGKTEILTLRTLYLLLCKGVSPRSIFITTFTRKAALELEDRILFYFGEFRKRYGGLSRVEPLDLWIGTLHSLAREVLEEFKYSPFENVAILDDIEQKFFILNHSAGVRRSKEYKFFWNYFKKLFRENPPSYLEKIEGLKRLFNGLVEFRVDLEELEASEESALKALVSLYRDYREKLSQFGFIDFSHLQELFLDFLDSPESKKFLEGDEKEREFYPGISYVMVDEYQDTNPIQEEIYFKLAWRGNLCVVGDDFQALYRFRGASVICFVNFDKACRHYLDKEPKKFFLVDNYRSGEKIVEYANLYIDSFSPFLSKVEGKPKGRPKGKKMSTVRLLKGKDRKALAKFLAKILKALQDDGADLSYCALLVPSARSFVVSEFEEELRKKGIEVYNTRSRSLLLKEEIKALLGFLVRVINPELSLPEPLRESSFGKWLVDCLRVCKLYEKRSKELKEGAEKVKKLLDEGKEISLLEIYYMLLSLPPFREMKEDPESSLKLARISRVLSAFSNIPSKMGERRKLVKREREWLNAFYLMLALLEKSGLDEPEDEEVVVPKGKFPIMTIHQAKGLEFPVVFVYKLRDEFREDPSLWLEELLLKFSRVPYKEELPKELSQREKNIGDISKKFYVAFTRPKYLLGLLVTDEDLDFDPEKKEEFIGFPEMNPSLWSSRRD